MGDEVKSLTEEVAVRSAEVENLSGEKVELQNQLNTVYYIVGAEKELRDAADHQQSRDSSDGR